MKKPDPLQDLINQDLYQVFLFACPVSVPFSFARHPWFVVNKKGSVSRWEVLWKRNAASPDWGYIHKDAYGPTQGIETFFFSKKHFWKNIELLGSIEGGEGSLAHKMADFIENSAASYPHRDEYSFVGVNSNTYAQWVINQFPESGLRLKWNSFGKGRIMKR